MAGAIFKSGYVEGFARAREAGLSLPSPQILYRLFSDAKSASSLPSGAYWTKILFAAPKDRFEKGHDLFDEHNHWLLPKEYLMAAHEKSEHGIFHLKEASSQTLVSAALAIVPLEFEKSQRISNILIVHPQVIEVAYHYVHNSHAGSPSGPFGIPIHERDPEKQTHYLEYACGIYPVAIQNNPGLASHLNAQHNALREFFILPMLDFSLG